MEETQPHRLKPEEELHNKILEFIRASAAEIDNDGEAWREMFSHHPELKDTKAGVSAVAMNYANKVALRKLANLLVNHDLQQLNAEMEEFGGETKE